MLAAMARTSEMSGEAMSLGSAAHAAVLLVAEVCRMKTRAYAEARAGAEMKSSCGALLIMI